MNNIRKLNIIIALLLLTSLFACTHARETVVATESEISTASQIEEVVDDRFNFANKDELFAHYFADFYNYIRKVRNGDGGKEDRRTFPCLH